MAKTLEAWLHDSHSLPEQLRVIGEIAGGLNRAHEEGTLHQALTPTAVLVGSNGDCQLTNFASEPTPVGALGPAAAYAAPEVLQGAGYTAKSDIYSAGVMFYEILSGTNPFARGTPAATIQNVEEVQPTSLSELRRDVKKDLTDAIMACLEKDPDWRPKDLSYILEIVGGAAQAPAAAAKTPRAEPKPAAAAGGTLPSFGAQRPSAPSRLPLFAGLAAAVVAVAVGAWFVMKPAAPATSRGSGPSAPPAEKPPEPAAGTAPEAAPPTTVPATPKPQGAEAQKPTPAPPREEPRTETKATPPPAMATPEPRTTATPTPTPEPTPTPAPERTTAGPAAGLPPPTAPAEPAALTALTPPSVKRHSTTILDVHGTSLRSEHQPMILKGREAARGISVLRQRLMNPGLLQVVILVDEAAAPGTYTIVLADPQGRVTNALRFDVAK